MNSNGLHEMWFSESVLSQRKKILLASICPCFEAVPLTTVSSDLSRGVIFLVCVSLNEGWWPGQMFSILADREGGRKGGSLSLERWEEERKPPRQCDLWNWYPGSLDSKVHCDHSPASLIFLSWDHLYQAPAGWHPLCAPPIIPACSEAWQHPTSRRL